MLLCILTFNIRDTEEYSNNNSGKKLKVIGIKAEVDYKLHYNVVNYSAKCNCKKPECKVFENLAENNFTNNNSGKSDYDSPLPILTSAKP